MSYPNLGWISFLNSWNISHYILNRLYMMTLLVSFNSVWSVCDVDLTTSGYCQPVSHSVLVSQLSLCHVQLSVTLWHFSSSLALYWLTVITLLMGHWFFQSSTLIALSPSESMLSCGIDVILFCFFWDGRGSRGWYDDPQPAMRPVLAQCVTPCVWGCLYVWLLSY